MDAAVLMAWMDLTADARVALLWELRLAIAGLMLRFGLTLAPLFSCDFVGGRDLRQPPIPSGVGADP
jgi:hypothetical protein